MKALLLTVCIAAFFSIPLMADDVPFTNDLWDIQAKSHKIETFQGKESIYINQGSLTLKDQLFENGTIEYDVFMTYQRGFSGIRFRIREEDGQYLGEEFYIRGHLSGMPDATQYTPIFNDNSSWQLYHGPQYSVPYAFKENEWLHVKINVAGDKADIYLGDMDKPALAIESLKTGQGSGTILLYTNFAPMHFANFSFDSTVTPVLIGEAVPMSETPATRIKSWNVSSTFDAQRLDGKFNLDGELLKSLTWRVLEGEEKGITNLSRISVRAKNKNTVMASKVIYADEDTDILISIGYSDAAKVYLNGEFLYEGSNLYTSRDYRYLGTIGLFEAVPLRLKKGKNTLNIAVSEAFGGWGIMADIPHTAGIKIQ